MSKSSKLSVEAANAVALAELVTNPSTTPALSVRILTKLSAGRRNPTFFDAMFHSKMSYGACPKCKWEGHWLIPENELNQMGHVSADFDARVKRETTKRDCEKYAEACSKRRVNS